MFHAGLALVEVLAAGCLCVGGSPQTPCPICVPSSVMGSYLLQADGVDPEKSEQCPHVCVHVCVGGVSCLSASRKRLLLQPWGVEKLGTHPCVPVPVWKSCLSIRPRSAARILPSEAGVAGRCLDATLGSV